MFSNGKVSPLSDLQGTSVQLMGRPYFPEAWT